MGFRHSWRRYRRGARHLATGTKWLPADNRPERHAATATREKLTGHEWTRVVSLVILIPVMAVALRTDQEIFRACLIWGDQQFQMRFMGSTLPTPTSWLIHVASSGIGLVAFVLFKMFVADRMTRAVETR